MHRSSPVRSGRRASVTARVVLLALLVCVLLLGVGTSPAASLTTPSSAAPARSSAAAGGCPSVDESYTGNCGPMFTVPSWTDAGGWDDPSQYSTIQLADLNGDGRDELIGRSDAGIQIYRFDTTLGQWRPQVDGKGAPQLLSDFASFLPSNEADPANPNQPKFYSTIQAADVDGKPGAEILGRFQDGMRVFKYTAPAGGGIDGGSWSRIGTAGPFKDADGYDTPSLYSTIQVVQFGANDPPLLLARRNSDPQKSIVTYRFDNGTWLLHRYGGGNWYADAQCGHPACYLDLNVGQLLYDFGGSLMKDGIIGRNPSGLSTFAGDWVPPGVWFVSIAAEDLGYPLGDVAASPDCPFSDSGATGAGSGDCLGSSPAYYETWQVGQLDGLPGDELLARASDGLRLRFMNDANTTIGTKAVKSGPTLTALAGAPADVPAGMWGSIRTGDLDGDGKDEVLFLDRNGKGLQVWTYKPAINAWSQMVPSTPLALDTDPWLSKPEYYSTIQTGDVDGNGSDDLIVRGPYGIRTLFWRDGGWQRYLPEGYPDFATAVQRAAFADLNSRLKVRAVWASEGPPLPTDLTTLQDDLVAIGNCTNRLTIEPRSYGTCTAPSGPPPSQPPAGTSSDEWNAAWTAVLNQMLTETYYAGQVVDFFTELANMRQHLFVTQNAALPAIGDALGLQSAAATTTTYDPQGIWSSIFGTMASIAGALPGVGPFVSAGLWVAAEVVAAIPSSSPIAMSDPFPATYAGLQDKFSQMVSQTDKGVAAHSQLVRQDAGLLKLVGQLRASGAWELNEDGLKSAANQGFAIWAYRTLMPVVYDRYTISSCADKQIDQKLGNRTLHYWVRCTPAPDVLGVIGGGSQSFTAIGQKAANLQYPCWNGDGSTMYACAFDRVPPADLVKRIWAPIEETCRYQPSDNQTGGAKTIWIFGCSAGVDVRSSIGANTWGFNSFKGSFAPFETLNPKQSIGAPVQGFHSVDGSLVQPATMDAKLAAAQAPSPAPVVLGRPRHGHRSAVRGGARLRAQVSIPSGLRLEGATVRVDRLLFDPGHHELTAPRARPGSQPLQLKLSRVGTGRFAAAARGRRPVRITLRRGPRGHASLTLTSDRVYHTPRACHAHPASVAHETQPLSLHTRLLISDGRTTHRVALEHHLRCRRDAHGNVDRLEYVRHRRHPLRGGLAVTLRGPRSVRPGTTATYRALVHNRRRGGGRLESSLWDLTLTADRATKRIRELRRGRTRAVTFTVRVPRNAGTAGVPFSPRGRFCVGVGAGAPGVQADRARACSRVLAATRPKFTG